MDRALIMVIMVMRKSWMEVCVQHTRPSIKVISEAFRKEQTTSIIMLQLMREDILEKDFVNYLDLFQNRSWLGPFFVFFSLL